MSAPRILVTRSPHQASPLAEALRAAGLDPVLIPTIELAPPITFAPLDEAITTLAGKGTTSYHWLLFTSANAVEAFTNRYCVLKGTGFSPSGIGDDQVPRGFSLGSHNVLDKEGASAPGVCFSPNLAIAAIGPSTVRACEKLLGTKPTLIPPQAVAESLAQALLPHALQSDGTPTRFLLIRAEAARDHLPDTLRAAGAHVTIAPAYRTIIPQASIHAIRVLFSTAERYPKAITFTSSSTATNLLALLELLGIVLPPDILRISIGPITSQTLRDLSLPPHAESPEPTIPALTATVLHALPTT